MCDTSIYAFKQCFVVDTNVTASILLYSLVMESRSLVGAVVGACIGTALLYTVILLVSIGAVLLWNKRHR